VHPVPRHDLYACELPIGDTLSTVMRAAGDRTHGRRLRGLIVIMWRAGLRIQGALPLTEG
jgi:hypothetical protein